MSSEIKKKKEKTNIEHKQITYIKISKKQKTKKAQRYTEHNGTRTNDTKINHLIQHRNKK